MNDVDFFSCHPSLRQTKKTIAAHKPQRISIFSARDCRQRSVLLAGAGGEQVVAVLQERKAGGAVMGVYGERAA
jgi:hypothetical protein